MSDSGAFLSPRFILQMLIFTCPDDERNYPIILSRQRGALVAEIGPGVVTKKGRRVTRNEAAALALVKNQTSIPVPELYSETFFLKDGTENGSLLMEKVEGTPLEDVWNGFDDCTKNRICEGIWGIVDELQRIQKPPAYSKLYQCGADGSASKDVLIKDLHSPEAFIVDDDALRARIYERYIHFNGRLFEDKLPSMLPRSNVSVFTHGDLTPRNIMIDQGCITGVIDWEDSGWFPDYWEYANMMKPSRDLDWMMWMDRTKPKEWDISGIAKARKVLF
jgi:hypothetical protein